MAYNPGCIPGGDAPLSRLLRLRCLLALPALLAGCSVLAEDYPEANLVALRAFERGDFELAAAEFAARRGALDSDEFLSLAEQGMAWHVAGKLDRAIQAWLQATEVLQEFRDRPTVSGRTLTEGALSVLVNDKTLPYDGEGFEVALLHAFLAWDYLRLGKFDDAWVEVQRGYQAQRREEERYGTTYGMNRFARFLAALVHELDGHPDEAEIDLATLAREVPNHPSVEYALARVRRLQGPEGREERRQAEAVVVYEQGRMPAKEPREIAYNVTGTPGRISVPAFGPLEPGPDAVLLLVDGEPAGRTVVLEDVATVARENLKDRLAWLAAKSLGRSAARTIAIEALAHEAEEAHGEGAGIAVRLVAGLASLFLERADLRSWLTLPARIQVLRTPVAPGPHRIGVRLLQGGTVVAEAGLGTREAVPGRPLYVAVRSVGRTLHATLHGGKPVAEVAASPASANLPQVPQP